MSDVRFKSLQLDDESLAQRQQASEAFQTFDKDKSGSIDSNVCRRFVCDILGVP